MTLHYLELLLCTLLLDKETILVLETFSTSKLYITVSSKMMQKHTVKPVILFFIFIFLLLLFQAQTRDPYIIIDYLYIESHHERVFMGFGVSDGAGDLSPDGATHLLRVCFADPGLEPVHQTPALVGAPGEGIETLVLTEEVGALLEHATLHGGGALPLFCMALRPQGQGQQRDHTLHHTGTRITVDHKDNW